MAGARERVVAYERPYVGVFNAHFGRDEFGLRFNPNNQSHRAQKWLLTVLEGGFPPGVIPEVKGSESPVDQLVTQFIEADQLSQRLITAINGRILAPHLGIPTTGRLDTGTRTILLNGLHITTNLGSPAETARAIYAKYDELFGQTNPYSDSYEGPVQRQMLKQVIRDRDISSARESMLAS